MFFFYILYYPGKSWPVFRQQIQVYDTKFAHCISYQCCTLVQGTMYVDKV